MRRSDSRILTTHVGSLIRPADLLERSNAANESPTAHTRYEQALLCATVDVVKRQVGAELDIVNDGEFGKSSWSNYVLPRYHVLPFILEVRARRVCDRCRQRPERARMAALAECQAAAGQNPDPGVVTHHTTTVERPRLVADRIVRYASMVGREDVIAGTDCGFAQLEACQRVHPQVMWAKLDALADGARLASKELWGDIRPVQSSLRSHEASYGGSAVAGGEGGKDRPCVA